MLAKLWKKVALAVCLIAILFNVTSKLVKRTNLKDELQSVVGGEAISFSGEDVNEENETENTTDVEE